MPPAGLIGSSTAGACPHDCFPRRNHASSRYRSFQPGHRRRPDSTGRRRTTPRVDLRAHWGYTHVLDDTPPQAWVGGGSLTAAVGPNLRLGVEMLHANMFGKYQIYKERARLITPVAEYEFRLSQRLRPYLVIGIGYTQYRSHVPNPRYYFDRSLPEFHWEKQPGINWSTGVGARLFLTRRLFLAPEVRIGLRPILRSTVSVGFAF